MFKKSFSASDCFKYQSLFLFCLFSQVCVCVCVRACVRLCVCARACVRACMRVRERVQGRLPKFITMHIFENKMLHSFTVI